MSSFWRSLVFLAALGLVGPGAATAGAQTGRNILIVGNALSQASDEIATYYATKRSVPSEQVLRLNVPIDEEISRAAYETRIERPIANWLTVHGAQDRILYLVLTKDVPLRIEGTGGQTGTTASVDSELSLLYRRMAEHNVVTSGAIPNPYFVSNADLKNAKPFNHRSSDLYLVARLDGYTVADVKALIDRGSTPSREGIVVLDGRFEITRSLGNLWLASAAEALRKLPGWNERVVLDTTGTVLDHQRNVLGYYSWGSNDRAITARHLGNAFAPGALAGEFVSTDARTFHEPPTEWKTNDRPFRGSHQSLIGDLIRDGVTGVAGHVAEPYLSATIRPDTLFVSYASGFNLIESFYLAMPSLSWQTVVIGDPLCAPFERKVIAAADLEPGIDETTELPQFLSDRRIGALTTAAAKPEAVRLTARAEVRVARDDRAGARELLERAIGLDPQFTPAQFAAGALYEELGAWDAAIAIYDRLVASAPNDAVALNNLAYLTATKRNDPEAALPIAKRALIASKASPESADTLAWVHYLLGNYLDAERFITGAVAQRPAVAEIRFHSAAITIAKGGDPKDASRDLEIALQLDPSMADREDVQALQAKLPKPAKPSSTDPRSPQS